VSDPFVGEIRMFGGNFAPAGWMFCEGQSLPISEYDVLFNLIGTTYGGDGQTTFNLPDLRGRIAVDQGGGFTLGQNGGDENVTLTASQMPAHAHTLMGSGNSATSAEPAGAALAGSTDVTINPYGTTGPFTALAPDSSSAAGGGQPMANMQPYLCVSFIISLFGIYPGQ
jgi:microcystin-dependent protein